MIPYWLTGFVRGESPVGSTWRTTSVTRHDAVAAIAIEPVTVKTSGLVTEGRLRAAFAKACAYAREQNVDPNTGRRKGTKTTNRRVGALTGRPGTSLPRGAVEQLPRRVDVSRVPSSLVDQVEQHPTQVLTLASPSAARRRE